MLEFTINESAFFGLFSIFIVFFAVLWTISYILKFAR